MVKVSRKVLKALLWLNGLVLIRFSRLGGLDWAASGPHRRTTSVLTPATPCRLNVVADY